MYIYEYIPRPALDITHSCRIVLGCLQRRISTSGENLTDNVNRSWVSHLRFPLVTSEISKTLLLRQFPAKSPDDRGDWWWSRDLSPTLCATPLPSNQRIQRASAPFNHVDVVVIADDVDTGAGLDNLSAVEIDSVVDAIQLLHNYHATGERCSAS